MRSNGIDLPSRAATFGARDLSIRYRTLDNLTSCEKESAPKRTEEKNLEVSAKNEARHEAIIVRSFHMIYVERGE